MPKVTLKAARINAGLKQEEAAEKLGISAVTLSRYERFIAYPDVSIIKKIEDLYGIPYAQLQFTKV